MSPLSGFSSPTIMRNSVVLPTPLGPMTPTIPLRGNENDKSSISSRSSKPLLSLLASITVPPRRGPGDLDLFEVELSVLVRLGSHLLVALQTCRLFVCVPWHSNAPTRARRCSRLLAFDVFLSLHLQTCALASRYVE